jgi:hypothetical protein
MCRCFPTLAPGVDFLFLGSWVQFLTPNFFTPFWGEIVELLFSRLLCSTCYRTLFVDCKGTFSSQKVGGSGAQLPLCTRNWLQKKVHKVERAVSYILKFVPILCSKLSKKVRHSVEESFVRFYKLWLIDPCCCQIFSYFPQIS